MTCRRRQRRSGGMDPDAEEQKVTNPDPPSTWIGHDGRTLVSASKERAPSTLPQWRTMATPGSREDRERQTRIPPLRRTKPDRRRRRQNRPFSRKGDGRWKAQRLDSAKDLRTKKVLPDQGRWGEPFELAPLDPPPKTPKPKQHGNGLSTQGAYRGHKARQKHPPHLHGGEWAKLQPMEPSACGAEGEERNGKAPAKADGSASSRNPGT